jgi:hypothetical protein
MYATLSERKPVGANRRVSTRDARPNFCFHFQQLKRTLNEPGYFTAMRIPLLQVGSFQNSIRPPEHLWSLLTSRSRGGFFPQKNAV